MLKRTAIKKQTCKCGCGKNKTFNCGGYFWEHMPEEMKAKKGTKRQESIKKKNARLSAAFKIRKDATIENKTSEQELWYLMQMNKNSKVCDNCGASLAHYNNWEWRSSQNHIVDKSPLNGCPSVATHPDNCNVLGMWCCHGQWGTSFLNQSKMKCFESAKQKFQLFKDSIPENELRKVNPYLT